MNNIKQKPILILDFGSQYTQLIGRRIREMGVYCEIHHFDLAFDQLHELNPCGIILSGGPATVTQGANPRAPEWVFTANIPVLGICYGMQAMAIQLGGSVESSTLREFGYAELQIDKNSKLFYDIFDRIDQNGSALLDVWMSHGDHVVALPPNFHVIASSSNTPIAGMADELRHLYGLQCHPEVTQTLQGQKILARFVIDICQAQTNWTPGNIIDEAVENIKQQVGRQHVLLALSGGVDSSVTAALLHRAIGEQLVCVFVDTGLLRLNEAAQVMSLFSEHVGFRIIKVDAEQRFLHALQNISCPEEKRKIIGHLFVTIFEEQALLLSNVTWLAQGTIYSDVIESGAATHNGTSEVIKSHHNVGGLPDTMNLKLLEPLRNLFKDEVRQIGLALGLSAEMLYRHPFPGAGLGIRILGEVKKLYADILRNADDIFISELKKADLYHKVSQAFAVFLPIKSVGVMGDGRKYDYVICLRAVETIDFMTACWAELPWDFLAKVSNRIINEVSGVSRVTYDISGKPPATIEWE